MENRFEIHFAPIQGYTDWIYRNTFACFFGGVDAYYTPFIRLEKGNAFRNRDMRDLDPKNNTVARLIPQILPGSPEEFRILAGKIREMGYRQADINFGCPFPLIAHQKKGAGILPYPERVKTVLQTIDEFPDLDFSLKMRLGWESAGECMDLLSVINNLRLCWITVHARTGKQQYKGTVDEEGFASFYRQCTRPLFYNGDLISVEQIQNIVAQYPLLRGVFVGRGLLSSPLLAADFQGNETFSEELRKKRFFDFHEALFSAYESYFNDERLLLQKMKSVWDYFLPETDRKWLKRIHKAGRRDDYQIVIKELFRTN